MRTSEAKVLKQKKTSLLTPLLEFNNKRHLPYPMGIVPPIPPVDEYDDAKLIGSTYTLGLWTCVLFVF